MNKGMLLLLAGSSGSGKNTVINYLLQERPDIEFLVSHTTRQKRDYEQDGVTYHFVSVEEFERAIKNNEMLEYDITHKGYYGISKQTINNSISSGKIVVKDISVKGIINCKKQLSHRIPITSIFLTESKKVLKQRLINRGEKNYKLRLKIYGKEQSQMGVCDYIIKNSQINNTIAIVENLINHSMNNVPLLPYKKVKAICKHRVLRYAKLIEKGKKLKPINVALINEQIYILDKPEKYLASLLVDKSWPKRFINQAFAPKKHTTNELEFWYNEIKKYSNKF